jgi:hypothetical protein
MLEAGLVWVRAYAASIQMSGYWTPHIHLYAVRRIGSASHHATQAIEARPTSQDWGNERAIRRTSPLQWRKNSRHKRWVPRVPGSPGTGFRPWGGDASPLGTREITDHAKTPKHVKISSSKRFIETKNRV